MVGASSLHTGAGGHRGGSGATASHSALQAFFSFLHCFFSFLVSAKSLHVTNTASQSFSHTSFWNKISSSDEHGGQPSLVFSQGGGGGGGGGGQTWYTLQHHLGSVFIPALQHHSDFSTDHTSFGR